MRLKEILWKFGLIKELVCPRCGGRLKKRGFFGHNERYTCNECDFGNK